MAITASSPDAFFDGEDFAWQQTILQEDGVRPLDLTGSRLFVRFWDVSKTLVGVCDSGLTDGSLVIAPGTGGVASFLIPAAGRTWKPQFLGFLRLSMQTDVIGDLYRYAPGSSAPQGICRIDFTVLPGTGASS